MRLIWVELSGYRRFEKKSRMNVDSKLVAIIGPNEAGKSSFLKALQKLNDTEPFISTGGERELTRDAQIPNDQTIIKAGFLLEAEDWKAVAHIPGAANIRWMVVSKNATGKTFYVNLIPRPKRPMDFRL